MKDKIIALLHSRRFWADTISMVIFCFSTGIPIEMWGISLFGQEPLSLMQSLRSRGLSVPSNLLTGGVYGVFRDWVFRHLGVTETKKVRKKLCDLLAFIAFQIPLYAVVLTISGARWQQITIVCSIVGVLFLPLGILYGWFMEWMRKKLGVYNTEEE